MTKNPSPDFSRRILLGGSGSCPTANFGTTGVVPFDFSPFSPNEFGAQNFRHQPLAKPVAEEFLEHSHVYAHANDFSQCACRRARVHKKKKCGVLSVGCSD
jgi:hypothetical protein